MFWELSIEYATVQHPRNEILVIFWGQNKVMFSVAERVAYLRLMVGGNKGTVHSCICQVDW